SQCRGSDWRVGRSNKRGDANSPGTSSCNSSSRFAAISTAKKLTPVRLPPGPGETGDETKLHRIVTDIEYDRNRRRCRLGLQCRMRAPSSNHRDPAANQFAGEHRQPIGLVLGPAIFDSNVLAFDEASVLKALAKCAQCLCEWLSGLGIEKSDHRHC